MVAEQCQKWEGCRSEIKEDEGSSAEECKDAITQSDLFTSMQVVYVTVARNFLFLLYEACLPEKPHKFDDVAQQQQHAAGDEWNAADKNGARFNV